MERFYTGQEAEASKCFTMEDVRQFAILSGDDNPLHVDGEYAENGRFGRCVVHGILVSGLISRVLGTQLPGEGSIYLEQNLSFRKPVYVGDTVTARVRITEIRTEKNIIILETNVYDQEENCVILGTAKILYDRREVCF
ncbi:MAG: MaoC family dehydratase [Blautia sp.]|nr:MaoC family dehydratase [Blautia sp.]